ncbi:hypothetical protein HLH36_19455 [Gluconacetobacter aggeris]|uniref:Uncharacterized protein n=1 Tax=Gluconacetobacter aggeris TaxID=1286186 RepID=A0A7W4IWQ4_9PROT|nr:hypothetical protein [Gluconacetobacter aggeris]MBB2170476.1 hypothetical protein [Gluconacetobacter aggeris]
MASSQLNQRLDALERRIVQPDLGMHVGFVPSWSSEEEAMNVGGQIAKKAADLGKKHLVVRFIAAPARHQFEGAAR